MSFPHIRSYLDGTWEAGADAESFAPRDPSTGAPLPSWPAASREQLDRAVVAARSAVPGWSRRPFADRVSVLEAFASAVEARADRLAAAITREAGKPPWEARTEVKAVVGKVTLTLRAWEQRCAEFGEGPGRTRFKPHGVLAVLGPFNFPAHLPNGHIVPALLAGNTVVFKPSEHTPAAAMVLAECWEEAGLPGGVLNVVVGGGALGAALAEHADIDGLLFTGGPRVGRNLRRLFAERPGKMLALELGGNNPLVAWDLADPAGAAPLILQSRYVTAGQRCTCAQRLVIPRGPEGDKIISTLLEALDRMRWGPAAAEPEPFMGPMIHEAAAGTLMAREEALVSAGAERLRALQPPAPGTGLIGPGILDVTPVENLPDEELFGPLLLLRRVATFEEAVEEANRTRYGLAAGLLSDRRDRYDLFFDRIRAGVVNWNTPLTGASGAAPFGGVGESGNHRPSGFFAVDYCAYPVASLERESPLPPDPAPPGLGGGTA